VATVRPNSTLGSIIPLETKEDSLALISARRCCRRSVGTARSHSMEVAEKTTSKTCPDARRAFPIMPSTREVAWRSAAPCNSRSLDTRVKS